MQALCPGPPADPIAAQRPRYWLLALRACIAIALTAGLMWRLDAGRILDRIQGIEAQAVALAGLVLAVQYLLASLRWHIILRRHGVDLPATQLHAIFGAGAVANIVVLNAIAGISVRGALLLRQGQPASRVIGVLVVERMASAAGFGLCFLVGVGGALPLLRRWFDGLHLSLCSILPPPDLIGGAWLVVLSAAAASLAAALSLRRCRSVRRLVAELKPSFRSPAVLAALTALSAIIIWLGFAAVALLAQGMGLKVSATFFLAVMPVVALLAALPVSIGGWGVREGAMAAGLALFHVPADAAVALSITYGLLGTAITALLGGAGALLLWLGPGRRR